MTGPMSQVHCDEFIPEFEKQYPEFPWKSVQVSPEQSWRGLGWPQVVSVCHLWMVLLLPPRLVTRRCGVTWRGSQGMLGTHTSTGQPPQSGVGVASAEGSMGAPGQQTGRFAVCGRQE